MITIGNTTYYTPYRNLLPPITEAENEMLTADIAERGIVVPVVIDPERNVIDGHNRLRIAAELGLTDILFDIRVGLSDDEKRRLACDLNDHRRHMTKEQRQERAIEMRRNGATYQEIGEKLGVDTVTAYNDIKKPVFEFSKTESEPAIPEYIIGKDGKKYPTKKNRKTSVIARDQREANQAINAMEHITTFPETTLTIGDIEQILWKAGPRIEKHSIHFSSETDEWYTPQDIIGLVVAVLGEIDLDPCSNPQCSVPANQYYTKEDDGLSKPWHGRIYMNPPYGREIEDWVSYLCQEWEAGRVTEAIALVPSRTDTRWFRKLEQFTRCFIYGRLNFNIDGNKAPFPSMAVYLGRNVETFKRTFGEVGGIYKLDQE